MVDITIEGDKVRFQVEGWDKLWAFKSEITIPLAHITEVRLDPESARGWFHGIRIPGTQIPGLITAGTFLSTEGFLFYDVHDPENTIVIELAHEHYKRLVIEVADPSAAVATIRNAAEARR